MRRGKEAVRESRRDRTTVREVRRLIHLLQEHDRLSESETAPYKKHGTLNRGTEQEKSDEIAALASLMQCHALRGQEKEALETAEKMGKLDPMKKNYFIASTYSLLGKPDQALKYLRMAKEDGVRNFIEWKWDINLLPLKDNPEFKKLLK